MPAQNTKPIDNLQVVIPGLELTLFRGHLIVFTGGVRDAHPNPVYSPQYRQQLVELVLAGRSANEVAKEFGLHATTVANGHALTGWQYPVRPNIPEQSRLLGH